MMSKAPRELQKGGGNISPCILHSQMYCFFFQCQWDSSLCYSSFRECEFVGSILYLGGSPYFWRFWCGGMLHSGGLGLDGKRGCVMCVHVISYQWQWFPARGSIVPNDRTKLHNF